MSWKANVGQALLVSGTIIGTLGGARTPGVSWTLTGVGLALLVAAGVLLRQARGGAAATAAADVGADMTALAERLRALANQAPGLKPSAMVERIAALHAELVVPIGDRVPFMLKRLGAQRFADVFGTYAGGERALSRAWSAAADEHAEEARAALAVSAVRVAEAVGKLEAP